MLIYCYFFFDVEWTLYEEVAIAAMDCQSLEVAKVTVVSLQHNVFWI
jgi:hypothetical protein